MYRKRSSSQRIRDTCGWLKKCLQQKWWQDFPIIHQQTDARLHYSLPKTANEKLTQEQKVWYERAIAQGICLPAAIEELPIRMGSVCARVMISNPRPYDPPFDVIPIEQLMGRYSIENHSAVQSEVK